MVKRTSTAIVIALLWASLASAAGKKIIQPKEFPAGRPFSAAILADGTLYVSGQIGADLKTGKPPAEFEAEVRQCLDNIGIILKEAGFGYEDVVSVQVYLTDIGMFQRMNAVYTSYFKEPRPTRTTVAVAGLGGGARLEITVTAKK